MARHRTIGRVARILALVASRSEGSTLSELASELDAPTTSILDLLNGLTETGYLNRVGARYLLGPAPYVLTLAARQSPADLVTHTDLDLLAAEGSFTVLLGVRVGDDIVWIDDAGGHPLVEHFARTHQRVPLLGGVAGKALVAALPDQELHEFLRRHPDKDRVVEFLGELTAIREGGVVTGLVKGFTPRVGPGDETGLMAVAVRDQDGRPIAVVVIGQHPDFVRDHFDEVAATLRRHAEHWATRRSAAEGLAPRPIDSDLPVVNQGARHAIGRRTSRAR